MQLFLIGLGTNSGDLSVSALEKIKSCSAVVLRTQKTQSCKFLIDNDIDFITLDGEYDRARNFDTLSKNLAKKVIDMAKEQSVCYLVDGAVSEDSSCKIILKKIKGVEVYEGVSKAKSALINCGVIAPTFTAFSAYDIDGFKNVSLPLVIYDLDNFILASEWKLKLSQFIGEEQNVWLYIDKTPKKINLYELDRFDFYDYTTAVVIDNIELTEKTRFDFSDLYDIVKLLRAPNGCPWDRVQTKESIRKNLIEECYELVDAIDSDDDDKILEEIGDVLLQAVFHTIFADERGAFTKEDVLTEECKKLIFRHSHIFGKDSVTSSQGALEVWDKNKQIEKGFSSPKDYVLDVPKCFPGAMRAQKCIKRVAKYQSGDCEVLDIKNAFIKILDNIESDVNKNSQSIMFLSCLLLKKLGVDGEEALYFAVEDFLKAFACSEENFDCKKYIESLINN